MKKKEIITSTIVVLVVGFTIISKIMKVPQVFEQMRQLGLEDKLYLLALIEIVALTLYVIPKTHKIGFLLLTAYFAGAIAININIPANTIPAMGIMSIIWIVSFVKNSTLFFVENSSN